MNQDILSKLTRKHLLMFMATKELPLYGKVFAWAICAAAWLCVATTAVVIFKGLFS